MEEVLQFLKDNPTFYIATIEDNEPRLRPFGFVMEHKGKLYFSTSNQKQIYAQLKENCYTEICTANAKGEWVRIRGRVVFDPDMTAREKVFEVMPMLKQVYQGAENPAFEVFYLDEAEAAFCSMTGAPRMIKL